jgi:OPA family sugar phosphate sensor protein UhpC-like MFS transporter
VNLRKLQIRVFVITWMSYAVYYLTRKNLSITKSRLVDEFGLSTASLGSIDAFYLTFYAFGQFINGGLSDSQGAKKILAMGLLGSALCSVFFGLGSGVVVFTIAFAINGFFQSAGWPSGVKAMGPWFDFKSRGKIMGLWSTNYQVGGLIATILAALLLSKLGWRSAFFLPALLVGAMGIIVWFFLPQKKAEDTEARTGNARSDYFELIKIPEVWSLGFAYFGIKVIRYSLLFWLPFYLHRVLGYEEGVAGYLSLSMEIGGILGAILAGYVSDRYFPSRRSRLAIPMLLFLALSLLLYRYVGAWGWWPNFAAMGLVGFFLYGPDTLISGVCAQDVGGERLTASAAGFINGLGSVGGILQGWITVFVSERYGWNVLFYFFVLTAFLAALAMIPVLFATPREARMPAAD